jgi:hypothetical protein
MRGSTLSGWLAFGTAERRWKADPRLHGSEADPAEDEVEIGARWTSTTPCHLSCVNISRTSNNGPARE